MKTLLLILLTLNLSAQDRWPKLTPQQDLTFDYYSNVALSYGASKVLYHFTKDSFWSGAGGLAIGLSRCFLERGLRGVIVSGFGAVSGNFVYDVDMDQQYKRKQKAFIKLTNAKRLLE